VLQGKTPLDAAVNGAPAQVIVMLGGTVKASGNDNAAHTGIVATATGAIWHGIGWLIRRLRSTGY